MKDYDGKVRLVLKLNPYKYRDFAHLAAEAARSAFAQGKFEKMHYTMLENSPKLDRESLMKYAEASGLDMRVFAEDLDKMRHQGEIERDKALAKELDLYNTPAFFINGRKVLGNVPYEHFKKVLDEELIDAKGK